VVAGNHWKVSPTVPFGCFVNPNNAAGWLIVCLAAAMYLTGGDFQSSRRYSVQSASQWTAFRDRVWYSWLDFVGRVAEMTTGQILSVTAVILLIAGIATTLSRAGIMAALLGLIAFSVSRVATGRWPAAFCSLIAILVVSVLFLSLMDLDTVVLSELQTLQDPVSDSTGRLLHWSSSLRSCLDFPLIGSGVSAYRCASMPYQRHYTGKWFQRADNQYVEVLVESGLLGFTCFIGLGVLGIVLAMRNLSARNRRPGPETTSASWLASSVILAITALSGAAFFDYGVSLTSVASGLVAMLALLENQYLHAGRFDPGAQNSEKLRGSAGGIAVFLVWLSLIGSSVVLLPDSAAAAESYSTVAAAERLIAQPNVEDRKSTRLNSSHHG
jgi:O-antigen ligase